MHDAPQNEDYFEKRKFGAREASWCGKIPLKSKNSLRLALGVDSIRGKILGPVTT